MKKHIVISMLILYPAIALGAPTWGGAMTFKEFIQNILIDKLITPLTALVVSLIILFFFYNSAIFLFKTGASAGEKEKIINSLIWSMVIMFLLVSVWGVIKLLASTLTLETAI